jgi:hypothetical protein
LARSAKLALGCGAILAGLAKLALGAAAQSWRDRSSWAFGGGAKLAHLV